MYCQFKNVPGLSNLKHDFSFVAKISYKFFRLERSMSFLRIIDFSLF